MERPAPINPHGRLPAAATELWQCHALGPPTDANRSAQDAVPLPGTPPSPMEAPDFLATAKLTLRGANGVAHDHHRARASVPPTCDVPTLF